MIKAFSRGTLKLNLYKKNTLMSFHTIQFLVFKIFLLFLQPPQLHYLLQRRSFRGCHLFLSLFCDFSFQLITLGFRQIFPFCFKSIPFVIFLGFSFL
jgi:hypothetical protein